MAPTETGARSPSNQLTEEYAERILPLVKTASRAYGSARPGSPVREASDEYNQLLLEYQRRGGNITQLAKKLGVADVTLRRRLRVARSGVQLGATGLATRGRGSRDKATIEEVAARIEAARGDTNAYHDAVEEAYAANISLYALAKRMGVSYHSLYAALRSP